MGVSCVATSDRQSEGTESPCPGFYHAPMGRAGVTAAAPVSTATIAPAEVEREPHLTPPQPPGAGRRPWNLVGSRTRTGAPDSGNPWRRSAPREHGKRGNCRLQRRRGAPNQRHSAGTRPLDTRCGAGGNRCASARHGPFPGDGRCARQVRPARARSQRRHRSRVQVRRVRARQSAGCAARSTRGRGRTYPELREEGVASADAREPPGLPANGIGARRRALPVRAILARFSHQVATAAAHLGAIARRAPPDAPARPETPARCGRRRR